MDPASGMAFTRQKYGVPDCTAAGKEMEEITSPYTPCVETAAEKVFSCQTPTVLPELHPMRSPDSTDVSAPIPLLRVGKAFATANCEDSSSTEVETALLSSRDSSIGIPDPARVEAESSRTAGDEQRRVMVSSRSGAGIAMLDAESISEPSRSVTLIPSGSFTPRPKFSTATSKRQRIKHICENFIQRLNGVFGKREVRQIGNCKGENGITDERAHCDRMRFAWFRP